MTAPSDRPAPFASTGVAAGLIAVGGWVLALVRPWGDVGVDDGSLVFGLPVALLAYLGVGAFAGLVAAIVVSRRVTRGGVGWSTATGLVVALVGVTLTVVTARTAGVQVLPRDGSWWGLLTAFAVTMAGVAVGLAGLVRPAGRVGRLGTLAVAVVVPVALVVTGVVGAPGWSTHRLVADHPAAFDESPGPATLDHVQWEQDFGADLVAVLGGRVIVARDNAGGSGCDLDVRALDAGSRAEIWSVVRPLRCDGPRLAALDGNNSTVRLTLRGGSGGEARSGPALSLYLGLEDGRPFTPPVALDRVQAWTEGFGLVLTDTDLQGLDSRTGVTLWSRPLPTCGDRAVTVGVPAAPAPGERVARTPYDGGTPNGTVPVVSVGNDVVVGTTCAETGRTVRRVWLIDAVDGPKADRTIALPALPDLVGDTDHPGAGADTPTTFLTWLDTVVVAVPVETPAPDDSTAVALVGLDRPAGTVLWTRPAATVRTLDVSPADGFVSVSGPPSAIPDTNVFGTTVVLGARTGAVLAEREEPSPVLASVALTGGRAEFMANRAVVVRDPVSGAGGDTFPTPDCRADLDRGTAPALAGPGGVVLRCSGLPDATRLLGLVDQP